jgi:hypothetical protein
MSQTLVISDELYAHLSASARRRGFASVEELLAEWQSHCENGHERRRAVQTIDALRARLFATYGEMPDSTELIREDRER